MKTYSALVGDVLTISGRRRAAVVMQDGNIAKVISDPDPDDLPKNSRTVEELICPGFIDLQINGGFGADVGPDAEALRTLAARLPQTGVTAFLPTAISWPMERYDAFFEALDTVVSTPSAGAHVLGAHLEGPFLSESRKGAHDPGNLRSIDLGFLRELLGSKRVCMMTLAPELSGALEAIWVLLEEGVVVSAGHTQATYEQLLRALDAGLKLGTHLYNAMSPMEHRAPGVVGALLTDDRVRVGLIADGVHVHEGALRLAYQCKGAAGLALVTDAMAAAGMPPGEYELSGQKVRLKEREVRLPDGTLAGSALTMDQVVRNAVRFFRISLEDAARMVTLTPAEILGLTNKGRIEPGADADLTLITEEGAIEETIVGGKLVYKKQES